MKKEFLTLKVFWWWIWLPWEVPQTQNQSSVLSLGDDINMDSTVLINYSNFYSQNIWALSLPFIFPHHHPTHTSNLSPGPSNSNS